MLALVMSIAALVATSLQMLVALVDVREGHAPALEVERTENQLVREQPRRRRRRTRRELRAWRDPQTERSLAYVDVVAFSWTLLMLVSAAATFQAVARLL